ncbi:MAG: hypothetical protein KDB21_02295, partial [Acidimicrobiales bacterium]|nr:hypothetical protein [Acidimicrobiales bacterium]
TVRALVQGEIDTFVGFKFIRIERLPKSGTDRACYAWATSGVMLGMGAEPAARIDERPDKGYATQVYFGLSVGATRLEEEKVVEAGGADGQAQPHQPARRWVEGKGWVDGDAEEAPQWVPGVGYVGDDPTGGTP